MGQQDIIPDLMWGCVLVDGLPVTFDTPVIHLFPIT